MSSFDIDLDDATVRQALRELKDEYQSRRVYKVGTNVEYAVYLEFGTRHMPPYPFFRPAIRELEADAEAFIAKHTNTTIADIDSTDGLVKAVAFALERAIAQNANAAGAVDRSPGVDPEHPKIQSGNLVNSISAERIK